VGQINDGVGAVTTNTTKVPANWETWFANNATNRYQVTGTVYDLPAEGISPLLTQNASTLRNRVSYSTITPGQKGSEPVEKHQLPVRCSGQPDWQDGGQRQYFQIIV
jgi:hypothetical protein